MREEDYSLIPGYPKFDFLRPYLIFGAVGAAIMEIPIIKGIYLGASLGMIIDTALTKRNHAYFIGENLGDADMLEIANNFIIGNPTEKLDLRYNNISDYGALTILTALEKTTHTSIKKIKLEGNRVQPGMIDAIDAALIAIAQKRQRTTPPIGRFTEREAARAQTNRQTTIA